MFERSEPTNDRFGRVTGDVGGRGHFTVHDHGAHITDWSSGPVPVVWTSAYARYEPEVGIRGGIPICFPWFAEGRRGHKSPMHGFAQLSTWRLMRAQESSGVTLLEWRLTQDMLPEMDVIDRHRNRFDVRCLQQFGETLTITLRVRNTDAHPLVVEEAFHTYFHVGDVHEVDLYGLAGVDFVDRLTGTSDTQIGPVTFGGQVDRVYSAAPTTEIHDPTLDRRITISTENAGNTVVWNPGIEKAAAMPDFGDDEWMSMVCVESGNVRRSALHLNPGQSHDLTVRISVGPL